MDETALAWARARVRGPLPVALGDPVPEGMIRAASEDRAWLLAAWPDGATPALLAEYEIAPVPAERAGQARRVLAAVLRCCWPELDSSPWPGRAASVEDALTVFAATMRGTSTEAAADPADLTRRWARGDLRRLADSGWVLLDEQAGTVRPGPRVAAWSEESLGLLREVMRRLPAPPGGPAG